MTEDGNTVIVALVGDLMDRSRFGVLSGVDVHFVRSADDLSGVLDAHPASALVVDLGREGALAGIATGVARGVRAVAYGSHVDRARLDAARAAGAEVLPRSAFFSRLSEVLGP